MDELGAACPPRANGGTVPGPCWLKPGWPRWDDPLVCLLPGLGWSSCPPQLPTKPAPEEEETSPCPILASPPGRGVGTCGMGGPLLFAPLGVDMPVAAVGVGAVVDGARPIGTSGSCEPSQGSNMGGSAYSFAQVAATAAVVAAAAVA
eukprot:CAMPEP_0206467162 /NCGR_PEP_ID=MMETSP0324_2-20121206/28881_1 /ASSEMBLY_ACC=CAM_ASM_000836 /TAXON_ID=2866 /ORGANISM="Crypthecodinium cohnii, Strain Seligo" /LENGTH=147 /DNA_ID=CAMNT_0053940399 /DNA_START=268 /DNA_END=709 /DNA_ORIENTATION=+